ncbi:hypothetical protein F9L16_21380 [Agarivorans sp. B2Z047]|uniref:hypothetical protein n=1 Tax=Agarivorans sp. B2Z047 TaxID=2652721 RepID=UPI00128E282C|nr:hypothetical protein [Agarivorans sp. B2Z047]MPW31531.1 hypothetical protein [Agarivorans sp. B2Z047]UQN42574.1 hypothetical protein LQZ07_22810 [Agarivorans sp. B2Z047]
MKLDEKYRHQNNCHLYARRHARKVERKGKTYNRYKSDVYRAKGFRRIKAPKVIDIYSTTRDKAAFIDTIKFEKSIKTYCGYENVILDFSKTEHITAAAMLLIYAALDSNLRKDGITNKVKWSMKPRVNTFIRRSGLYSLLVKGFSKFNPDSDKAIPVIGGVSNETAEDVLDYISKCYYKGDMDPNVEFRYGDAVSETINNVARHAYPNNKASEKKWWLLCEVVNEQLFLAIYDLGVGVPSTILEKQWFWGSFESLYPKEYREIISELKKKNVISDDSKIPGIQLMAKGKLEDSQMIALSMKGDVSGTKIAKHGQGSKSIKALVCSSRNGVLWFYSKKGLYKLKSKEALKDSDCGNIDESKVEPTLHKLPKEIPGTLIQWNISIK